MSSKSDPLSWLRKRPLWIYAAVFALLLGLHVFMFRDVIAAIPAVLKGDTLIVREELIPFFGFRSQFLSDGASALTASDEVRVNYSFWTAWVRHYKVLPFALVGLNTLAAFLLFQAFHRLGRYFYKRSLFGVMAAVLAAVLVHTILLYAKIAHFYVLVIGFSMFALALSLACEQLFFKSSLSKRNAAAISIIVLLNPAIHFHLIFYVVFPLLAIGHLCFVWLLGRSRFWQTCKRHAFYLSIVTAASLIPYLVLVYASTTSSVSGVSTNIPVNYWMIYYASLGLPFIFSMDTAGHLDLMRYGNYLAPLPRFGSMVVLFVISSIFTLKSWIEVHILRKIFVITLFAVLLLAAWMTVGYNPSGLFSFHEFMGKLASFFMGQGNIISRFVGQGIAVFINILRFPHRFQFIYFFAAGVLFMIALVWLRDSWTRRFGNKPVLASLAVILVALLPILGSNDYRSVLASGDAASFVAPYAIPEDLKHIRHILHQQNDDKLFILPTLESGREIVTNNQRYSFLDKLLTYYLNQPTYYYGAGANTENKVISFQAYRSIAYGETWWEDVLAKHLGITHILLPKKLEARQQGTTYLPGIEQKIAAALEQSRLYRQVYSGSDFALYQIKAPQKPDRHVLIDREWNDLVMSMKQEESRTPNTAYYFPLQGKKFIEQKNTYISTASPEESFYHMYQLLHKDRTFPPSTTTLAFSQDIVASSNFTNNALSIGTLYAKQDEYNYLKESVPGLINLTSPHFIGIRRGDQRIKTTLHVPQDGTYRVLLHGASKGNEIDAVMGGHKIPLKKVAGKNPVGDYIDFTYYYADIDLLKGKQTLLIRNTNQNAVLVETIALMPQSDIPSAFEPLDTPFLSMKATEQPELYEVIIKGRP